MNRLVLILHEVYLKTYVKTYLTAMKACTVFLMPADSTVHGKVACLYVRLFRQITTEKKALL